MGRLGPRGRAITPRSGSEDAVDEIARIVWATEPDRVGVGVPECCHAHGLDFLLVMWCTRERGTSPRSSTMVVSMVVEPTGSSSIVAANRQTGQTPMRWPIPYRTAALDRRGIRWVHLSIARRMCTAEAIERVRRRLHSAGIGTLDLAMGNGLLSLGLLEVGAALLVAASSEGGAASGQWSLGFEFQAGGLINRAGRRWLVPGKARRTIRRPA